MFALTIPEIGLSNVRCDMVTPPGGWIVIQRRVDATVCFIRTWADYKRGFGNLNGNFWLGLEKIHQLAAPGRGATLRVDLKHMDYPGETRYAGYSRFEISNETEGYKLKIDGYSGNAGDSLSILNKMQFTIKNVIIDPGTGLPIANNGAWWYNGNLGSNLNGIFPQIRREEFEFMSWSSWTGRNGRIVFSEMKIKY